MFITIQSLEDLRMRSLNLKQRFSKTEVQKWTPSTVASELILQITHLRYSLLTVSEKEEIFPTVGIDKGLKDELSDVLYNALNVLSFLDLTLFDLKETMGSVGNKQISDEMLIPNLVIQAANAWDSLVRLEGYKHLDQARDYALEQVKWCISGVIRSVILIATQHEIDMVQAMKEMFADAEKFLDSYETNGLIS